MKEEEEGGCSRETQDTEKRGKNKEKKNKEVRHLSRPSCTLRSTLIFLQGLEE